MAPTSFSKQQRQQYTTQGDRSREERPVRNEEGSPATRSMWHLAEPELDKHVHSVHQSTRNRLLIQHAVQHGRLPT